MKYVRFKTIFIIFFGLILIIVLVYFAIFGRALGQPENHFGIALVLPKVFISSRAVVIDQDTYLSKNAASFIEEMKRQGFDHAEQLGAGYFFEKDGDIYISIGKMYSSHFMVFDKPVLN